MSTTPANWGEFANVAAVAAPAFDGTRVWNESGWLDHLLDGIQLFHDT
jgi:hypothetical protein